ncbi:MAG TPA: hypothetical protein VH186_25860 [Chloroflexia bacterium]|nr:hypothetical protein [Chloroflexia bacterium]
MVFIVILGVILFSTSFLGLTNGALLGGNSGIVRATEQKTEPDGKSIGFLNAIKAANAGDIYNTLNQDYRNQLKQRGINDVKTMQTLLDDKIEQISFKKGAKLDYSFNYQGGLAYSDGSSEDDFIATYKDGNGSVNRVQYVFKTKGGGLADIQTTDPVAITVLGLDKLANGNPQPGTATRNPSSTAERFMVGITTFDVDKVWDSLADSYKQQLAQQKITKESMSKLFDQIKSDNAAGAKTGEVINYGGFVHQETINFPNGTSLNSFISVLTVKDNVNEIGYNIFLDTDNKITGWGNFNGQDPILSAIFGRNNSGQ